MSDSERTLSSSTSSSSSSETTSFDSLASSWDALPTHHKLTKGGEPKEPRHSINAPTELQNGSDMTDDSNSTSPMDSTVLKVDPLEETDEISRKPNSWKFNHHLLQSVSSESSSRILTGKMEPVVAPLAPPSLWSVTKRGGRREPMDFDKITQRIQRMVNMDPPLDEKVLNVSQFVPKIKINLVDGMATTDIDKMVVDTAYYLSESNPEFDKLATRIAVSDNHKNTKEYDNLRTYFAQIERFPILHGNCNRTRSLMSDAALTFAKKNISVLQSTIDYKRDYEFDFFGYSTMMQSYAFKIPYVATHASTGNKQIQFRLFERPQHTFLRVALEMFVPDPKRYLSHFIHFPSTEPERVWEDNYDDWINRMEREADGEVFVGEALPASVKSVYSVQLDKVDISDFMNPFTIPAKQLLHIVKKALYHKRNVYKETMKYRKVYTPKEEAKIMNYVLAAYHLLSLKFISLPTPAFQSDKRYISCFLMGKPGDSIPLIYEAIKEGAMKARGGGGYGFPWTRVRATGSYIGGSNSISNGIIPIQKIFDKSKNYVDQGGNKRTGPCTAYIECWHADFFTFLNTLRTESGGDYRSEGVKGAVWFNELLLKRALNNEDWSFFCPRDTPNLLITFDKEFEKEYCRYESLGLARKVLPAYQVMVQIGNVLMDSAFGACHIMNCDTVNRCTTQKCPERGIKVLNSNICTEIDLISNETESATCTLTTICLSRFNMTPHKEQQFLNNLAFHQDIRHVSRFSDGNNGTDDEEESFGDKIEDLLHPQLWLSFKKHVGHFLQRQSSNTTSKRVAFSAIIATASFCNFMQNALIQQTSLPTKSSFIGSFNQRALGLGYQGFQNLLVKLGLAYGYPGSQKLVFQVTQATMYGAYCNSVRMAELYGTCPYWRSVGEEYSIDAKGILPFDFYLETFPKLKAFVSDWNLPQCNHALVRARMIAVGGKYNSKLGSSPPTATSSNVAGNKEGLEPVTNLTYKRRTLAGEFIVGAKELTKRLLRMGLWTEEIRLAMREGSIQNIDTIPQNLKDIFRSAWEIGPYDVMGVYFFAQINIDQSVSMNLWIENLTMESMMKFIHYGILLRLKSIVYYLHKRYAAPKTLASSSPTLSSLGSDEKSNNLLASSVGTSKSTPLVSPQREQKTNLIHLVSEVCESDQSVLTPDMILRRRTSPAEHLPKCNTKLTIGQDELSQPEDCGCSS